MLASPFSSCQFLFRPALLAANLFAVSRKILTHDPLMSRAPSSMGSALNSDAISWQNGLVKGRRFTQWSQSQTWLPAYQVRCSAYVSVETVLDKYWTVDLVLQTKGLTWSYLANPKSCFIVQAPGFNVLVTYIWPKLSSQSAFSWEQCQRFTQSLKLKLFFIASGLLFYLSTF